MVKSGVCCASLKDDKALMKVGLSMVVVGHVGFLLAALLHGAVLRHSSLNRQTRAAPSNISNVIALTAGLVGIGVGILAIILSKNKTKKILVWFLLVGSLLGSLLAVASTGSLALSLIKATLAGRKSLQAHCEVANGVDYSGVPDDCPFDPNRIYGTAIALWLPLTLMCVVESVLSGQCFLACISFLDLSCDTRAKRKHNRARPQVKVQSTDKMTSPAQAEPQKQGAEFRQQEAGFRQQEAELPEEELPEQQKLVSHHKQFNRASLWV